MKFEGKIKNLKKYFILLALVIFVFVISHLINNTNTIYIDLFGSRIKTNNTILYNENNEYYISHSFVQENIDKEIHFDNISQKFVISSEKGLVKVKIGDKYININYQDEELNKVAAIEKEDKYLSLEVLKKAYNIDITVCSNTIYIYNNTYTKGKIKNNNVSVYKDKNIKSNIVEYVDKKDKINIINVYDNYIFVKVNENSVGYILKNSIKYKQEKQQEDKNHSDNSVYMFTDFNSTTIKRGLPIDGVILNMFNVTQTSGNIIQTNFKKSFCESVKKNEYKLFGMIGNGYNLAGFNTNTMSQILSDESKRVNLINNLADKIKEYSLDGIVLDFRKLKEKDIDNYIQFIKELKAFCKNEVIVNIDGSEYKQYIPVINYTDFSIINAYGQRDEKSTVAGSVSEIRWMQDIVLKCLNEAKKEKLVVGIPAYTILWTEKNSNIVGSEIYNLKAIKNYIEKNNLELKEVAGQNYAELKKGSLVYKMWLEDEFSIKNRLKIIKENSLKGVVIYKLGYENDTLINELKNIY